MAANLARWVSTSAGSTCSRRVYRGEAFKHLGNDQRGKAAELVNAGILDRTASGGHAISGGAAFSLLIQA